MKKASIEIRQAGMRDIDDLVGLLKQLFAIEKDFEFNEEKHKKGLLLMLEGCGKHKTIKVALLDNTIVGMCTAQTRISTAKGGVAAILEDLVVDQECREEGVGKALLAHMAHWARQRGIQDLQLLADKNNSRALAFYNKQNWRSTQLVCLTKNLNI